jgi:hypothetical protein
VLPALASSVAIPLPMPRDAPVTMLTVPCMLAAAARWQVTAAVRLGSANHRCRRLHDQ